KSAMEHKKKEVELLKIMSVHNQLILDAGCGLGSFGMIFAQNNNVVLGIDISYDAAKTTKKYAEQQKVNYFPVIGDLERAPFKSGTFDICFYGEILHHFPNINFVISESCRILKSGGTFASVENNGSNPLVKLSRIVTRLEWGRWLLMQGYGTENVRVHTHNHYNSVLRRFGFTDIKFISCYHGLPIQQLRRELYLRSLRGIIWSTLNSMYALGIHIQSKALHQPHAGNLLLFSAVKRKT
ncbi:MAG TPA: class I SAM-dependent methyltransferase, partial [Candidatus Methylomirabilis sp.]|nr:class I SAM-dependent methyltransferase [Candidatus Methylomirabilis sp.]